MINKVLKYLSMNIRNILQSQSQIDLYEIYEIRLRINMPVFVKSINGDYFITYNKKSKLNCNDYYKIKKTDLGATVAALTSNSIHAFEREISRGYLTIEGGHRVGIGGDCIYENNKLKGFKNITSLNIRISKDFVNCSKSILKYIIKDSHSIYNTLIAGPPLSGKTTVIRDIARNLSDGTLNPLYYGCDVTIIDERGEIAAIHNGIPQVYVGGRTDVMSYCMKSDGFMMSIRSLAPKVIISDELGSEDDYDTIHFAIKSGVNVITTCHCYSLNDLFKNSYVNRILSDGFIERVIVLGSEPMPSTVKQIYDNINDRMISDVGS